jgi:hypothetical protein
MMKIQNHAILHLPSLIAINPMGAVVAGIVIQSENLRLTLQDVMVTSL